jgi:dolichol-phosphate mannosyltransferase
LDIILAFSDRPLKASIFLGFLLSSISLAAMLLVFYRAYFIGFSVTGWASLLSALFFSTGIILMVLGISAIYIGEVFRQVKNRPLYVIDKQI